MTQYEYEQRMQREVWLVITLFAILVMCLGAGYLHAAEPYVTAGFGQATLHAANIDNLWQQTGFDHKEDQKSNAWKIGVGLKLNRYLDTELDYRDLGKFNSMSLYTDDNGRPGDYNPRTRSCNGPCGATVASWQNGSTTGVGLSLVAHPNWTVAPFIRLGTFYHASKFTVTQAVGDRTTTLIRYSADPRGTDFSDKGIAPMIGAGVRWRGLELEYTRYPKASGPASPYQDISTVILGIRWEP